MNSKRILAFLTSAVMICSSAVSGIAAAAETLPKTEESAQITADSSSITVESTNSFGKMLAPEIQAKQQEQQQQMHNGNAVFSVQMEGLTASVRFQTAVTSSLFVGIYDESGEKLLGSGTAEVNEEQTEAQVEIEMEELPQYYLVKCYLTDQWRLTPLSSEFVCRDYTQDMQTFYSMTVHDYPEERVLNFDEDETNNFAVFTEDVIVLNPENGYDTVVSNDDENAVYVFENPDSTLLSLKQGDLMAYAYNEDEIILARVETLTSEENSVTITDGDISLYDFFVYIHIDDVGTPKLENMHPAEGVTLLEPETRTVARSENSSSLTINSPEIVTAKGLFDDTGIDTLPRKVIST